MALLKVVLIFRKSFRNPFLGKHHTGSHEFVFHKNPSSIGIHSKYRDQGLQALQPCKTALCSLGGGAGGRGASRLLCHCHPVCMCSTAVGHTRSTSWLSVTSNHNHTCSRWAGRASKRALPLAACRGVCALWAEDSGCQGMVAGGTPCSPHRLPFFLSDVLYTRMGTSLVSAYQFIAKVGPQGSCQVTKNRGNISFIKLYSY